MLYNLTTKDAMTDPCILDLANVSKYFGGLRAVHNVSMSVPAGQRRALIGSNGAGKTTVFNLIAGDLFVTEGSIKLFGKEVTRLPVHQRSRLGLRRTYQTPALFTGLTVQENLYLSLLGCESPLASLKFWCRADSDREKMLRAEEIAVSMELMDMLYKKTSELSHGERKQLEVGVTLAAKPKLLLLDEPAAGLSSHERTRIMAILQAISTDITIILIEHDMALALELADIVTVLYEGAIMAEGAPDAIRANQDVQRVYLGEAVGNDS